MSADALVFMIPTIIGGGLLRRSNIRITDYVAELDGLVLQGGAVVSPLSYGETAIKAEWAGDRARVNSIHHQGIKTLGKDLTAEALSAQDSLVEAIRRQGPGYAVGVQWHPEFHDPANPDLLDGEPLLRDFLGYAETTRDHIAKR